jgi:hypothetical protein
VAEPAQVLAADARELRASRVCVTLVVHEHKRPRRDIDLAVPEEELKETAYDLARSEMPRSERFEPQPSDP